MKKLNSANKRVIVNLAMVLSMAVAVILMISMNKLAGPVNEVYFPKEGVYGIPYNIGFRWSTILGMCGVILYQCAFYVMAYCKWRWRMPVCLLGLWLYAAIVFPDVSLNSRIFIELNLRDAGYDAGLFMIRLWNRIGVLPYIVTCIVSMLFIRNRMTGQFDETDMDDTVPTDIEILTVILMVLGVIMLILVSFTNPWYPVSCICAYIAVNIVMTWMERFWRKRKMDTFMRTYFKND